MNDKADNKAPKTEAAAKPALLPANIKATFNELARAAGGSEKSLTGEHFKMALIRTLIKYGAIANPEAAAAASMIWDSIPKNPSAARQALDAKGETPTTPGDNAFAGDFS